MKFNKLIIGLAVAPLLLASCSNGKMSLEEAKEWVAQHYHDGNPRNAIATLEWDYHATTGTESLKLVKDIFDELNKKEKEEIAWQENLFEFREGQPTIGQRVVTNVICPMPQLQGYNLVNHWGKENVDDDGKGLGTYKETFKVLDNALTISYTQDFSFTAPGPVGTKIKNVSLIRTYNADGYCTGYGFKIGRYYINNDNIMKIKLTLKFTYEDGNL